MRIFLTIILLLAITNSNAVNSHAQTNEILLTKATIRQPINNITSAYIDIINNNSENDKLINIKTTIAKKIELHQTIIDENGTAKMQQQKYINIKKNSTTKLSSGKTHIMLIDLTKNLALGEKYKIDLIFEKAGKISTMFEVKKLEDTLPKHNH